MRKADHRLWWLNQDGQWGGREGVPSLISMIQPGEFPEGKKEALLKPRETGLGGREKRSPRRRAQGTHPAMDGHTPPHTLATVSTQWVDWGETWPQPH